jgi:hypothetical protein
MDKKILVEKVKSVIQSFQQEDKGFSFVGLVPVYPGIDSTSYILSVRAAWLEPLGHFNSISIISQRLFELLDKKTLRYINRVEILDENQEDGITQEPDFQSNIITQRSRLAYEIK